MNKRRSAIDPLRHVNIAARRDHDNRVLIGAQDLIDELVLAEWQLEGAVRTFIFVGRIERRWEDSAVFNSYYPQSNSKTVAYKEGIFLGYRHFDKTSTRPLFPFGYGLSYTTFKYSNLAISPGVMKADDAITVSFDVTNTGEREGSEVAQVYVGDRHASVPRPLKELKGFAKVHLMPHETRRVSVTLDRRALSFYDVDSKQWKAEAGNFDIYVASSAEQINLQGKLILQAGEVASGNMTSGNVTGK